MTIKRTSEQGGIKQLKQALDDLDNNTLQVGWFEGTNYDEGTPVAAVAAQNEFGNPLKNIPPRPFVRPAINQYQGEWKDLIAAGAKQVMKGNETAFSVLDKMGLLVSGQVRAKIIAVHEPALSPVTIKARLRVRADKKTIGNLTKPLIFEGILLNSTSYSVNEGEIVSPYGG